MSTVLLLHSALGLRPAVGELAARIAAEGHQVVTPDYYDGQVFDDTASGVGYRDQIGGSTLLKRVRAQLGALPDDTVLAGISLGAAFAQRLAYERPAAKAVILLHGVGAPRGNWPGAPVQVHRYAEDSWIAPGEVAALSRSVTAAGATFDDIVVAGRGHLFTDAGVEDFDADATGRSVERITRLLATTRLGRGEPDHGDRGQ